LKPVHRGGRSNNSRSRDGDENVNVAKVDESKKHFSPTTSRSGGSESDLREKQWPNALPSIRTSFESFEKVTDLSRLQLKKQYRPMISRLDGRTIDFNAIQPLKALSARLISCESGSNGTT
jgi:hypothetical protein